MKRGIYPRARSWAQFPSVPHLHPSGSEAGDVVLSDAELRAVLARPLRVYEKLDGLNVGVCFSSAGELGFVSRAHGLVQPRQLGPGMWPLLDWTFEHLGALSGLLGDRYVLYGEWLAGPRRLAYPKLGDPFVALVLYDRTRRHFLRPSRIRRRLVSAGLSVPPLLAEGRFESVQSLLKLARRSTLGGPGEGVVVEQGDRLFKAVRPAYLRLPVMEEAPTDKRPAVLPKTTRSFTKRFDGRGVDAADREVAFLRAMGRTGLAPCLVRRPDRSTVVMSYVSGRPFPDNATGDVAFALGRALRTVHQRGPRQLLGRLADSPFDHAKDAAENLDALAERTASSRRRTAARRWARAIRTSLLPLLRANSRDVSFESVAPCHGDLQPANLRVSSGRVVLLDFERAVLADPAWELACAGARLGLDLRARAMLLRGYGSPDRTLGLRVQLFQLVSNLSLPASVLLANETPDARRPGPHAQWLCRQSAAAGRRLLELLGGRRLPALG